MRITSVDRGIEISIACYINKCILGGRAPSYPETREQTSLGRSPGLVVRERESGGLGLGLELGVEGSAQYRPTLLKWNQGIPLSR
ncbi:hypothetical protein KQX54_020732 [Cotesia glomerata]|uniref:Uncharacterized protein n=1 Tax=Cotesia glomerata TaxID=32391 RepID=A0AAV7IDF1_COTGL|nr:hypothetical protein KQX54_020732 [Cotesia glomerata]